jgi:hypothetical protein
VCGIDLNEGRCDCVAPAVESQWAVLDQLKEQLGGNGI